MLNRIESCVTPFGASKLPETTASPEPGIFGSKDCVASGYWGIYPAHLLVGVLMVGQPTMSVALEMSKKIASKLNPLLTTRFTGIWPQSGLFFKTFVL